MHIIVVMRCADRIERRIYQRIFTYSADYLEKWVCSPDFLYTCSYFSTTECYLQPCEIKALLTVQDVSLPNPRWSRQVPTEIVNSTRKIPTQLHSRGSGCYIQKCSCYRRCCNQSAAQTDIFSANASDYFSPFLCKILMTIPFRILEFIHRQSGWGLRHPTLACSGSNPWVRTGCLEGAIYTPNTCFICCSSRRQLGSRI